jgi:hypothetical protein
MSLHRLLHLGQLGHLPNEARRWRAEVSRCRIERLNGRKLATQADGQDLEHLDRFGDIP